MCHRRASAGRGLEDWSWPDRDKTPVIGRDARLETGVAAVVAAVFVMLAARLMAADVMSLVPVLMAVAGSGSVLYVVVAHRHDRVRLDEDALVVESASGTRRFPWAELLEVGWVGAAPWVSTPGVVVRPEGGPWDDPGPDHPRQVATLAVVSPSGTAFARGALRQACARAGVPFVEDGEQMFGTPRPDSPWRHRR